MMLYSKMEQEILQLGGLGSGEEEEGQGRGNEIDYN